MSIKYIPTWTCDKCGYAQDYEPTVENHAIHFPEGNFQEAHCPSCGTIGTLTPETDPAKMTTHDTKDKVASQ